MSSHGRRHLDEYGSYWEQSDADAHALATLFPDWPGREEELPDWLQPKPVQAIEPDTLPPMPESVGFTPPTPVIESPVTKPRMNIPLQPKVPQGQAKKPHLYAPVPKVTAVSPYLKPLANKSDSAAVWTHITPQRDLPFTIQTITTLSAIPPHWAPRGFAHRNAWVAIQLLQGGFNMVIDDGEKTHTLALYSTDQLLLLPPLTWRRFVNVLDNTLLLCLSSHPVAETLTDATASEWVTEYADFLSLRHASQFQ